MLVSPRPGVNRENLLKVLNNLHTDLINLRGGAVSPHDRLLAYLEWTSHAVRLLTNQIKPEDIKTLVLTRRYELLLAGIGGLSIPTTPVQRAVEGLVSTELNERANAFDEAIKELNGQITRWSTSGKLVLPDSSFYIQHPQRLEDADISEAVHAGGYPIHVIVPIAVVDELDRLKENNKGHVRWRAGYTLAVIDHLFQNTTNTAVLRPEVAAQVRPGFTSRGAIFMDLLFDPPGHSRLRIIDDEIVDRATTIEPIAGRKVTLLTYDTGQSTRARAAGLDAIKLTQPVGEEPNSP